MSNTILAFVSITVLVAVISSVTARLRAKTWAMPNEIAVKGLTRVTKDLIAYYGILVPSVVGFIGFHVYNNLMIQSPDTIQHSFLFLTLIIGIILQILAGLIFKMRAFQEFLIVHTLYIIGYGILIPIVLNS